jgi:NAD(P)-dependent dehydrogenase (short-subunit alcohol dehydrogenase family)
MGTFDGHLTGVFHCCRVVVPAIRAANYGRIVNVASIADLFTTAATFDLAGGRATY